MSPSKPGAVPSTGLYVRAPLRPLRKGAQARAGFAGGEVPVTGLWRACRAVKAAWRQGVSKPVCCVPKRLGGHHSPVWLNFKAGGEHAGEKVKRNAHFLTKTPPVAGLAAGRDVRARGYHHSTPTLDASPKRSLALIADGPDTPLHSPPIGLK
jgi:hypothetical protein